MKNPYDVLGISRNATQEEIKRAFRRLAKQYHPDTGGSEASVNRFNEVYDAYSFLMDSNKRNEYDRGSYGSGGDTYENNNGYDEWENQVSQEYARSYINAIIEQLSFYKSEASSAIGKGLAWLIGGLVVTGVTYAAASDGGTYIITWGAFLFGGIQAIRGIAAYFRINSEIGKVEKNLWEEFDRQYGTNSKYSPENNDRNREEPKTQTASSSSSTSNVHAEHVTDDGGKNPEKDNWRLIIGSIVIGIIVTFLIALAVSGGDSSVNQYDNKSASMDESSNTIVIGPSERAELLRGINLTGVAKYVDNTYKNDDLDKLAYIFRNLGYEIEAYEDLLVSIAHYQSQNLLATDGMPGPQTMGALAIGTVDKIHGYEILGWVQENKSIKMVYGWASEKIDTFIYYVTYGVDDDSDQNNGWYVYCYEVNLENSDVSNIMGNEELEQKYRELGFLE